MKVNVKFYTLSPRRFIAGTKGSYGFEKIDFSFSEEWKDLGKKVVFYPPNGDPVSVTYKDEPVTVPYEVMSTKGISKYCVFGYRNENVLISTGGEIDVINTLDDTDNQAGTPTPSDVEQVYTYLAETVAIARDLKNDAESGVFDGKDGITPHIAENGNWFFGDEDSGVCARGDSSPVFQELGNGKDVTMSQDAITTKVYGVLSGSIGQLSAKVDNHYEELWDGIYEALDGTHNIGVKVDALEGQVGDVETALDGIIAIQNTLIGGDAE